MRTARIVAAMLTVLIASCAGQSNRVGTATDSVSTATSVSAGPTSPCPADARRVGALLGVKVTHVEGATRGSTEQVCAFSTSSTDPGALGVIFLRFPRPELGVATLAEARQRYGSSLAGHTVVSMPSWGADAFLDDSLLPDQNLAADIAWVSGFEIILGMHATDPQARDRRQLVDQLVALTR